MLIDNEKMSSIIEYNKKKKQTFLNYEKFDDINIEYERILKSRYNKSSRVKQHLVYLLKNKKFSYFLTFTFDDKYIKKCDRTRKDMIKNCLKNFDTNGFIILNIDYGKKNERLHYHAVFGTDISSNLQFYLTQNYPCFTWCQPIILTSSSVKKISKYINKLTNHCIKDSTKNSRIYFNFKGYSSFGVGLSRIIYLQDLYDLCE